MAFDTFIALVIFAFVASVTPGPNNMMLLASGVNFGYRRTIPHMFGIAGGFFLLLICVGAGLGTLLTTFPAVHTGLKIAGGLYLLYLAWKIATAGALGGSEKRREPMSFLAAAMFQWVNPKAWMMGVSAMAIYTDPAEPYLSVLLVAVAFVLVNFPSVSVWAGFGTALRGFLADDRRRRIFNGAMGVVLALCIVPMVQ
ncbi:MAG: LysE family translocator [Rhodospirillales bacterium]|nr:LysE family translocator [Rhodospirillales bacterium]MBO6788204.1 LysE family translocator [Rhodospirillales bacterium]